MKTQPEQTQNPIIGFMNERRGKIMSGLIKEAAERWREMSEEAKRPHLEKYATHRELWILDAAMLIVKLEEIEKKDKSGGKEKLTFTGRHLFWSEVLMPGASAADFMTITSQIWNDLTPEEREAYHERARKINEKGQNDLLASTLKKIRSRYGPSHAAYIQFRYHFLSEGLKEAQKELNREWSGLRDEEREKYAKPSEMEIKIYNAQMEQYGMRGKYAEKWRNMMVIKTKIKEIEEEMNKPKLMTESCPQLFMMDIKESLTVTNPVKRDKMASEMWEALTEEERMEYKAKWRKLKADWQTDVALWEEGNADNPKMTELKAYKEMLETSMKK